MTSDHDEKIAAFLRQEAPPAHDPVFRVKVLERREQQRFRQHFLLLGLISAVLVVIGWIGISVGGETAVTTIVLAIGVALAAAYVLYAPAVARLLRRFRI
jgi:hypothetical protein